MQLIYRLVFVLSLLCTFSAGIVNADSEQTNCPSHISKNSDKKCPFVECINNCSDCHNICIQTINYCMNKGGKHADAKHIKLLADCAQMCQTSADFMNRQSSFHPNICKLCAELCEKCADSCESLNDENLKECVEMCRKCAKSCTSMGSHSHDTK